MPALWPSFIPALASDISGQSFTKPGGALVSFALPKVGKDQVPIFPPTPELLESVKPGNPLNANLSINPADFINAINLNPLSGRYDFGVRVAERYIAAVKGKAMTPFGATHTNNPAAEFLLKQGYGLIFERILKEGDIPLQDKKDKDGNIIEMGKESHPAYADFCPDPIEMPDPIEEEKKQAKKFTEFINQNKNNAAVGLKKFKHFEFHCLDGNETQDDFIKLIVNRLLQKLDTFTNSDDAWNYILWATSLGKARYSEMTSTQKLSGGSTFNARWPYPNATPKFKQGIEKTGFKWAEVLDGVSLMFLTAVEKAYPVYSSDGQTIQDLEKRVKKGIVNPIERPWPYDVSEKPECPLSEWKIQVSFDREHNLPDFPSKRPAVLTDDVVSVFSYDETTKKTFTNVTTKFTWWEKDTQYIKTRYEEIEYKDYWLKIPSAINNAKSPEDIINIDPLSGGTIFKFQRQQVIEAKEAAEECDAKEPDVDIDYQWPGGDPYEEMAEITIAYWYACLVKPFAPSPSALPALIPAPLTGIYVPIYYGGKKRLAKNLRRAWNSGKTFASLPLPAPPALVVSTAVAAAYALHLLEFKLLYLGGIPTPVGPVPMVGIVPVVF